MPEVRVPGDKSISHRALILAALADGESRLRGVLPAGDPRSTAAVLRGLGADVAAPGDVAEIRVHGLGLRGLRAPAAPLDCGNSGTTARLMLGVLAAQPLTAILTGDASLRSRPMRRVTAPLGAMGARFEELGGADRLPVRVHGGPLRDARYSSPRASAQVKSALLLAALCAGVRAELREPVRSRDHTERLLRALGVGLSTDEGPAGDGRAVGVTLEPAERIRPLDLDVPGDISSAAFFLALGLLADRGSLHLPGVGVNPTRTGLLTVLRRMGADVAVDGVRDAGGEPVADLSVAPAPLRATAVEADEIPGLIDEVPVLAVLAARAEGETRISGAGELRVKESDRLAALAANLRALGVAVEELEDGLVVQGTDRPLSGHVRSFGDHRIAMAFGVLAALPGHEISIDDPAPAEVSFPGFWPLLRETAAALGQGR